MVKKSHSTLWAILMGLPLPVALVVLWHWTSTQGTEWAFAFVPLPLIASAWTELWESGGLWINLSASVLTALQGLTWGTAAGLVVGLSMGYWPSLGGLLNPLIQALRQVPNLALIPLIVLWFGNTEFSKMLTVSMAVFEVIVLNTYEGLHRVDARFLDVARVLTLPRHRMFLKVLLPAALPSILTGLQHGVAFAWLATVGVELLFTVGPGLSAVMERAQTAARMEMVIVCLVLIAVLGYVMHAGVRWLTSRLLRWRTSGFQAR